jgi:tripartite-type tricarboxylate transporter receptor subunit TctC
MDRRRLLQIIAASALPFAPKVSWGEAYPSGQVRLLVGFPMGGPVDIAARMIGAWLSRRLGQPFVVDNQVGESGNVATRSLVRAAPDGYTLLVCGPVNVINQTLFPSLDFRFPRDITPVAGLFRVPLLVEVNPALPIESASDFLTYAKANSGKLRIAYAGVGTPQHVGIELFEAMAGVDLTLVPFAGSTPALEAVLAGKADAMFDPLPSSVGLARTGKLRPLAVTTLERSEALPGVPSMSEFVPGYEASSWFGIVAPKDTPAPIVAQLNAAIDEGVGDAEILKDIRAIGGMVMPGTAEDFARFLASEADKYSKMIRSLRIRAR